MTGINLGKTLKKYLEKKKTWIQENQCMIGDYALLILIYIFLFSGLKMEWFLRDIIPIGGDIPYHFANYIDFKEILIPNGQISGWSDASFAGLNLFQSYPIFPFILIYLFDLFVGSGVAFKAVLMLGALGLPLATYWTLLQTKVSRPGPIFGAVLSLAYLFHDDHFAFGGNLLSVFSGEFAHSLSILFLVIFCGFLFKAFENKKYMLHTVITLALIGFSHPISFAVAIFLPLFFLINYTDEKNEKGWLLTKGSVAFQIILIGSLLFCTWAIGYYVNSSAGMYPPSILSNGYGWGLRFNYLIPRLLLPFAIVFLTIGIYYIFNPKKISNAQNLFLWGFLVSIGFFLLKFMGFAVRFLPLVYLFAMFFIAATIGEWYQNTHKEKIRILPYCLIGVSLIGIYYFVQANELFHKYRGTSGYTFIGAESRSEWKSIALTSEFLSKNFDTQTEKNEKYSYPPRVFSVFSGDLFRVTSRATLYDSLFSSSFFYSQGIGTGRQIDKQRISVEKFWGYMELSNTKIIVAPEDLAKYLDNTPYFSPIKTFDTYKIFQTNNASSSYVVPLKNKVYALSDLKQWKNETRKWYGAYTPESPFIVYDPLKEKSPFTKFNAEKSIQTSYREDCQVEEFVRRETIRIRTNCIGRPLLVKFAYHQNWHVEGAKGIYLATPAFMVIIPEQRDITLYYGKRPYNYFAYASGTVGLILLFSHRFLERCIVGGSKRMYKKYRRFFRALESVMEKMRLKKIGIYLLGQTTPLVLILTLLASIAFVYTNRG